MKRSLKYITVCLAIILLMVAHAAVASFTGRSTEKNKKYSLSNLSKNTTKVYSLSSLRMNTYRFKGLQEVKLQPVKFTNTNVVSSVMRFENGNTTFVFPYKYTVKAPSRFVTPVAPKQ